MHPRMPLGAGLTQKVTDWGCYPQTQPSPRDRFLGQFIIPGNKNIASELRSPDWFIILAIRFFCAPVLNKHCAHFNNWSKKKPHGRLKMCSLPQQGEEMVHTWKSFLRGAGGRRACATQEINNQIFLKLLVWKTRQITSKVREERKKNPKFFKNTAIRESPAAQQPFQAAAIGAFSCLDPPGKATQPNGNPTRCAAGYQGPELLGADLIILLKSNLESRLWFRLVLSFTFKVQRVIM